MEVSIIIATMAVSSRAIQLKRAINSIRTSASRPVEIIVVVNGADPDQDLCAWLRSQPDVIFDYIAEPSAPNAIKRGVELVQTEYYGCLDDDDEYINMAIDFRLDMIKNNPHADCVISNGFRNVNDIEEVVYSHLDEVNSFPLLCLMRCNWLASCNFLFRKSSLDSVFFVDGHPFAEWTWLAFKLAMQNKKIVVVHECTFRINDTPGSLSKSANYVNSYISLFKRMLAEDPPIHVRKIIRSKLAAAYHDASDHALKSGDIHSAIKFHIKSVMSKNGYKYLGYSRYFFK